MRARAREELKWLLAVRELNLAGGRREAKKQKQWQPLKLKLKLKLTEEDDSGRARQRAR